MPAASEGVLPAHLTLLRLFHGTYRVTCLHLPLRQAAMPRMRTHRGDCARSRAYTRTCLLHHRTRAHSCERACSTPRAFHLRRAVPRLLYVGMFAMNLPRAHRCRALRARALCTTSLRPSSAPPACCCFTGYISFFAEGHVLHYAAAYHAYVASLYLPPQHAAMTPRIIGCACCRS